MDELEREVLMLLSRELTADELMKELSISEEALADAIINLEEKGFVRFEEKNWILTEKREGMFKEREEELKRLRIEHVHGRIDKEEYHKRKEEIERMPPHGIPEAEMFAPTETSPVKEAIEKIYCPKCGAENKAGYNYCRSCGVKLKEG